MDSRASIWIGLVAAACTLLAGTASALDAAFPITRVVTISGGMGGSRVLLDFGSVSALSEELILSARLVVPLSGNTPLNDVEVNVTGLTTSWGPGATWTSPWTTPGGDVDRTLMSAVTVRVGTQAALLDVDVTDVIRSMAEGDAPANGLLLKPDAVSRAGFNGAEMAVLGDLAGGEIRVTYRSLTAHGMRGGAESITERRRQRSEHAVRGG
jgi:hypothetical protein